MGSYCKFWTINALNLQSNIVINVWFRIIPLASMANLPAISLERMLTTFRPFKHRLIKKKMFGATIAAVWITSGLCSAIGVFVVFHSRTIKLSRDFFTLYLSFFLFFLLIIAVSYSSIAIKIVCGNQLHRHGATSRERKLTRTLFIVTVASLLLTLPFTITCILDLLSSHRALTIRFNELYVMCDRLDDLVGLFDITEVTLY